MKKRTLILSTITILLTGGVILALFLRIHTDGEDISTEPTVSNNCRDIVDEFVDIGSRNEFIGSIGQHPHPTFENFNFSAYARFLEEFPSDKIVGPIENEGMAMKKAGDVWIEVFGEEVVEMKPPRALYDESSDVWFLTGTLPEPPPGYVIAGSVPHIFIRGSDGQVLAVWMG